MVWSGAMDYLAVHVDLPILSLHPHFCSGEVVQNPRSPMALMLVILSVTQLVSLLEVGFASYAYPLRMPLDWAVEGAGG